MAVAQSHGGSSLERCSGEETRVRAQGFSTELMKLFPLRRRTQAGAATVALLVLLLLGASGLVACDLEVEVVASPLAVYPRGCGQALSASQSNITVTVTEARQPAPNKSVRMSAAGIQNMGGHIHDSNRPAGAFDRTTGTTDANGQFRCVYTASLVGGSENVRATVELHTGEVNLKVRVPYPSALDPGGNYSLVGQTSTHPDSHYGTASANAGLLP